jgi:hypothetical protein
LDDDSEGRRAYLEAESDGLASQANTSFIKCLGLPETELEDLYSESIYSDYFNTKYAVDVRRPPFNSKKKWSQRIRNGMSRSGKSSPSGETWPERDEMADKRAIAELVARTPAGAIMPARLDVVTAVIRAIEQHLEAVSQA